MTYEYECTKCAKRFDVIKSVKDIDVNEFCPNCEAPAERKFSFRVHIIGAAVQNAEYNPALGCVVKNKAHREEIAKRKGLVEIGNDFKSPDDIHKKFDQDRAEKKNKAWEDAG